MKEDIDKLVDEIDDVLETNAEEFVKHRLFTKTQDQAMPDFALISSDGVSKSFRDSTAFDDVASSYRDLIVDGNTLKSTVAALPAWLQEVTDNGSGDDATMCIATVSSAINGSER